MEQQNEGRKRGADEQCRKVESGGKGKKEGKKRRRRDAEGRMESRNKRGKIARGRKSSAETRNRREGSWISKHREIYEVRKKEVEARCGLRRVKKARRVREMMAKGNWFHFKPNKRTKENRKLREKKGGTKKRRTEMEFEERLQKVKSSHCEPGRAEWKVQHVADGQVGGEAET